MRHGVYQQQTCHRNNISKHRYLAKGSGGTPRLLYQHNKWQAWRQKWRHGGVKAVA